MAASAIQAKRSRQRRPGDRALPRARSRSLRRAPRRSPATAISSASSAKPTDQTQACARSGQQRLDRQRIGEQRRERAEVGRRIEHVRVARLRMAAGGEPALQQRRARRRARRTAARSRRRTGRPATARRHRDGGVAEAGRDADRQGQRRDREHAEMDQRRAADGQRAREQVRIGVAGQQRGLEEHHRDRPHRRRAAEHRQHHLGEHRLNGEQQQRGGKQRGGEEREREARLDAANERSRLVVQGHGTPTFKIGRNLAARGLKMCLPGHRPRRRGARTPRRSGGTRLRTSRPSACRARGF